MLGWHQSLISVRLDPFFRSSPIWEFFQWGPPIWESHVGNRISAGLCDKFLPRVRCLDLSKKWNQNCRTGAAGGELGEYEGSGWKFSAFFGRDPCIYSAPNTTALCSRYVHLTLECSAVLRSICCIMQLVLLWCYSLQWHWQWWMASAFTKQSNSWPIFITISTFFPLLPFPSFPPFWSSPILPLLVFWCCGVDCFFVTCRASHQHCGQLCVILILQHVMLAPR